jgi:O-antigen ligase
MRNFILRLDLDQFFIGLILFTLPFVNDFNSKIIIIALIFFFIKNWKQKAWKNLKYFWLSFFFFLLQFISFFNSTNYTIASKKIILFLPFLAFPLFFISSHESEKHKLDIYRLFSYLMYGVITILIYGGIRFSYDVVFLDARYDYGRGIALLLEYIPHHVYLSMFIIICIFSTLNGVVKRKLKPINFIFLPFLYLMLFFLGSRIAILIAVLIIPFVTFKVLKKRYSTKKTVIIVFFPVILLSVLGFSNKFSREKIIFTYYELVEITTKRKPFNGITYREQIWKSSFDMAEESILFGYGIGDVQYKLNSKYSKNSFYEVMGMNAHNQYFQFLLTYGIILSSLVFFLIFRLIKKQIQKKDFFSPFMWLIIFLFSFTESILNRHWGVVLFAFVLNISIYNLYDKKEVVL